MENARESIILAADLPDHQRIESRDKARAEDLASRFHQVFGECVYACGGTVNDTIGSVVIAELPEPTQAVNGIEALHKRIKTEFASEPAITPRAVLTNGEVHEKDFSLAGRAVQNALSILDSLKKGQMLVSSDLVTGSGHVVQGEPVLQLGDVGYYMLPLARPEPVSREPAAGAGGAPAPAPPVVSKGSEHAAVERTRNPAILIGLAIVVILVVAGAAFWLMSRNEPEPVVTEAPAPAPAPEPVETDIELSVGAVLFAQDLDPDPDPQLAAEAPILIEALLRSADGVQLASLAPNTLGVDVRMVSPEPTTSPEPEPTDEEQAAPVTAGAQLGPGQPVAELETEQPVVEPEPRVIPWVERSGERFEGPGSPYRDVWSIVVPAVTWAGDELGFETVRLIPQSDELREAFRRMVVNEPLGSSDEAIASLHQALSAEPEFLAGWLVLSRAKTDDPELEPALMDALRNISRLMPERTDLARDLGRRELVEGTLDGAIEAYARVRADLPDDEEALRVFGLAALAAHQPGIFAQIAGRTDDPRFHPADVAVSEGKINEAVKEYYETEAAIPDNPHLSFKIGRIAVLRRSPQIAQIEMDKLESSGAEPQRSFLRAYMAANEGDRAAAEASLQEALKNATWSDSPSFHAAEVYAILRDAGRTLQSIEQSVDRQEPMMHAIATNSLFRYLSGEARFREAVRLLLQHQRTVAVRLKQSS